MADIPAVCHIRLEPTDGGSATLYTTHILDMIKDATYHWALKEKAVLAALLVATPAAFQFMVQVHTH